MTFLEKETRTFLLSAFLSDLKKVDVAWVKGIMKIKADSLQSIYLFLADGTPVYWGALDFDQDLLQHKAKRVQRVLLDPSLTSGMEYIRFVEEDRLAVKPKVGQKPLKGKSNHGKT